MIHEARYDWKIDGCIDDSIDVYPLYQLADYRKLQHIYVDVSLIAHKELDTIRDTDWRYKEADVTQPVLLVDGLNNPFNKKYRMVDGRHRLLKLLEQKHHIVPAFVFSKDDFFKYCEVAHDVSAA